jgi:hypothetical protein
MSCGYYALDIPVARAMVGEHITVNKRIKLKKVDTRKLREGLGLNQSEFWERLELPKAAVRVTRTGAQCLAQFGGCLA